VGLAAVHIMDLPCRWKETFYLAVGYLAIIARAEVLIECLTERFVDKVTTFGSDTAVIISGPR
jgi:hypothetical protein